MSYVTASASLEWGWIEFVALGLLCPLVAIIWSTNLLHTWRKRRLR